MEELILGIYSEENKSNSMVTGYLQYAYET